MSTFLCLSSLKSHFRRTKEPKGTKARESIGGEGGPFFAFLEEILIFTLA
jgi:hypothetical protein